MKVVGKDILERDTRMILPYIHSLHTTEVYTFLDGCHKKVDCAPIYLYIQSLQEFQLKNVWNYIVTKWIAFQMFHESREDDIYHKSIYSKQRYRRHHTHCNPARLNDLLTDFIKKDSLKEIFVLRALVDHGTPFRLCL